MKTAVRRALDGVYVAGWMLLVATIWLVMAMVMFFNPRADQIVAGGAVALLSLVLLIPLTVVVARWWLTLIFSLFLFLFLVLSFFLYKNKFSFIYLIFIIHNYFIYL